MTHKKINKVLWRVLGILPFYLFAFLPLNAQKVQIDHPVVNVGKTGFEMPVTATFELKNKGSRHLSIVDVKTDCGCTKADYPKKSIGGGDKFTISMTYDARQLGHFTKQAAVWFSNSEKPLWLTMKGVVVTEMTDHSKNYPYAFGDLLADMNNVEFDDVKQGEHPEVEIRVLNNGSSVMTPNIQHLPPYLTSMASPETLAPGRAGKVTLMLNTEHLHDYGLTQTTVYLAEQLGNRVSADTELPVSVVLLPNTTLFSGSNKQYAPCMELSADSLTLGVVNGKKRKSEVITITNTGRTALNISSLQMFTKGLKVTLDKRELQPRESAKLKITMSDRNQLLKARQKPRVLMITNDPDHAKVVITINVE